MKDYLICPTGADISAKTFIAWCAANGLRVQDRLTSEQEEQVNALAASDPATIELLAAKAAAKIADTAARAAKEATIAAITGGLDRETVMALAKRLIGDSDYWPAIDGDTLVAVGRDNSAVWQKGADGWTKVTRRYDDESGAGYGMNQ